MLEWMRNQLDRLHACMDGGKVGPSEGTRLIPNLIPSTAEETPGSFFANVWEILDYAVKVLDEEAGMRDMDASLSDRLIDANQLQDEVRITTGSHKMEKQLEDLAVKVGVLEGALDNHIGVIELEGGFWFDRYDDVYCFAEECNESFLIMQSVVLWTCGCCLIILLLTNIGGY